MFTSRQATPRRVLWTWCPDTGLSVATHALMSERELRRIGDRRIAFFCSACRSPHQAGAAELFMGSLSEPLRRNSAGLDAAESGRPSPQ